MQSDSQNLDSSENVFTGEEHRQEVKKLIWSNIHQQIDHRKPLSVVTRFSVAASLIVLILSTILLLTFNNKSNRHWIAYTNTSPGIKKVWLADSSCVWVPQNASIAWRSDYNVDERKVELRSGECFFEVRKQHGRSFTVITDNIKTKVLGTSFLVSRDYLNNVKVSVLTGKVSVSRNDSLIRLLMPTDQLTVNQTDGTHQYAIIPANDIVLWKQGQHVLREQTMSSIANFLSGYYNTHITLDPLLIRNKDKYTFILFDGSSLDTVMKMIETVAPNIKTGKADSSAWMWKVDTR